MVGILMDTDSLTDCTDVVNFIHIINNDIRIVDFDLNSYVIFSRYPDKLFRIGKYSWFIKNTHINSFIDEIQDCIMNNDKLDDENKDLICNKLQDHKK